MVQASGFGFCPWKSCQEIAPLWRISRCKGWVEPLQDFRRLHLHVASWCTFGSLHSRGILSRQFLTSLIVSMRRGCRLKWCCDEKMGEPGPSWTMLNMLQLNLSIEHATGFKRPDLHSVIQDAPFDQVALHCPAVWKQESTVERQVISHHMSTMKLECISSMGTQSGNWSTTSLALWLTEQV